MNATPGRLLARRPPYLCAPAPPPPAGAGDTPACRALALPCARHFDVEGVTAACEYLAAQGLVGKASAPARLTKRSNLQVQERLTKQVAGWLERELEPKGVGVVIEADVEVGEGTEVLPGTVLHAGARLGARCRVGPYAVVAGLPMDHHFHGEPTLAVVEDEVIIREFVTVHRATGEGAETRIGTGSLVMSYVHVSHNTRIDHHAIMTAGAQLGGHGHIGHHAVVGGGALLHQFCRVGEHAFIGGYSVITKDALPYCRTVGSRPARVYGLNLIGLKRRGFREEAV